MGWIRIRIRIQTAWILIRIRIQGKRGGFGFGFGFKEKWVDSDSDSDSRCPDSHITGIHAEGIITCSQCKGSIFNIKTKVWAGYYILQIDDKAL